MDEKKFDVSIGLRWWPCCFVSRRKNRKNRRKHSTYIGKLRISACYFSRRLIMLWLFMTGLHPHPGPNVGVLVHAASSYGGPMVGAVFKLGAEGLGYYADAGRCSLELAPLLRAADSVPPLPIRLYALLGLGSATPRYPMGPSGSSEGDLIDAESSTDTKKHRARGGRNSNKRRTARAASNHSKVTEASPFVGADARRADDSHKQLHLLAYDSCNANAWRESATYLEATGADGVFFQETKAPAGLQLAETEQAARNARWNTSLQACNVTAAGGRSAGHGFAVKPHVGMSLATVDTGIIEGIDPARFGLRRLGAICPGGIHVGSCYLTSAVGVSAPCNLRLLEAMGFALQMTSLPRGGCSWWGEWSSPPTPPRAMARCTISSSLHNSLPATWLDAGRSVMRACIPIRRPACWLMTEP